MEQGMGSNFGKALGSIFDRRKSIEKSNRLKLIGATIVQEIFKGKKQKLDQ